jgi:alpha-amylase
MMQAFYWDGPAKENKHGEWWNFVAEKVPQLAASGISSLWLPPFSKAAVPESNGYDPYDYFDLGDLDQKGSVKTAYGNRAELQKLIHLMHEHKMSAIADMVINHNSGADEEETNPLDGQKRWTKFNPKSGKFPRDWNCFHPCRYERSMIEGENFAGFPHLCHRNPRVYEAMFEMPVWRLRNSTSMACVSTSSKASARGSSDCWRSINIKRGMEPNSRRLSLASTGPAPKTSMDGSMECAR